MPIATQLHLFGRQTNHYKFEVCEQRTERTKGVLGKNKDAKLSVF